MRPAKIQISKRIRVDWSEPALAFFWIAKDAKFLHAENEDSDQTARMRRLIWVFVWRICKLDVFWRCGSIQSERFWRHWSTFHYTRAYPDGESFGRKT